MTTVFEPLNRINTNQTLLSSSIPFIMISSWPAGQF